MIDAGQVLSNSCVSSVPQQTNQLLSVLAKLLHSMESKDNPVSLFSLYDRFGGILPGVTVSESADVEARKSSVLLKSVAGAAGVSFIGSESVAAAELTWAGHRFAAGSVSAPNYFGSALSSLCAFEQRSRLNCPGVESKVCPSLNNVNDFSSLCSPLKARMKSEDVASHNLKPSSVQPNMDVQLSETCQRRFIIFDNSGSKKRIIFHPAFLQDKSSMLPYNSTNLEAYLDNLQNVSVRAADQLREAMVSFCPEVNFGALPSHSGMRLRHKHESIQPCFIVGSEGPHIASEAETSRCSYNETGVAYSGDSHEDTEDLEALLCSDDEMSSTGHSPSDVTWNNPLASSDKYSMDYCHSCSSKKRKREVIGSGNEDDADSSTASSAIVMSGNFKWSDTVVTLNDDGSSKSAILKEHRVPCYSEEDLTAVDLSLPEEMSTRSSDTNQSNHQKLAYQHELARSRKDKIRNTLRMLCGIIPRGDCMDTAVVLDKAIQYVKALQVEVQKLEARKSM